MTAPAWRKSSASKNYGDCVEAGQSPGAVLVRDTRQRGGTVLAVPAAAWARFTGSVKGGA